MTFDISNHTNGFLRPIVPNTDATALHSIFGDEKSCRYLPEPAFANVDATKARLTQWCASDPDKNWAIIDNEKVVGRGSIIPRGEGVFEAAIMLCPDAHGRGLALRAVRIFTDLAFDHWHARRIFADIDPDNSASIRLFTQAGYKHEGILRALWETHIGIRDTVLMSMIRSDRIISGAQPASV